MCYNESLYRMENSNMATITVFTGAGVSAESGVPTFRDSNGLWEGHRVEDVASPSGFKRNPQLVWDFYRKRHQDLKDIEPNAAHIELAKLESWAEENGHEVLLITQNVDGLHQLAGSKNVIELHGELKTLKCNHCDFRTDDHVYWESEIVQSCPVCGGYMRPNIVWFGEQLDEQAILKAEEYAERSKAMVVVGTSGQVYPAAALVPTAAANMAIIYECNPTLAFAHIRLQFDGSGLYRCFRGKASATVPIAVIDLQRSLSRS